MAEKEVANGSRTSRFIPERSPIPSLERASEALGEAADGGTLRGSWWNFTQESSGRDPVGEVAYEACIGTTAAGCQLAGFSPVSSSRAWSHSAAEHPLQCGASYHLTVRATNCAGLQRVAASAPLKVCCSPPAAGAARLVDGQGEELPFVANASAAQVRWGGFEEPCSGVREYAVELRDASGGVLQRLGGLAPNATLAVELAALLSANSSGSPTALSHGASYDVAVLAMSHAGLSTASLARFVADLVPPSATVMDGGEASDLACISHADPVTCSWRDAVDALSGLARVEWAVGTWRLGSDLRGFVPSASAAAASSGVTAAPVNASVGSFVYCTLRLVDAAGMATVVSSDGARLVEPGCGENFGCVS